MNRPRKDYILKALLDLRIAIGQLQEALSDIEKCCRELQKAVMEDAKT